jgi:hypothetical protein
MSCVERSTRRSVTTSTPGCSPVWVRSRPRPGWVPESGTHDRLQNSLKA